VAIKRDLGGAGTQKGDLDQFINNLSDSIQANAIASKASDFEARRSPLAKNVAKVQGIAGSAVGAIGKGFMSGKKDADLKSPYGVLQYATASVTGFDEGIAVVEKGAKPYRQEVAPRISAAFLASSATYREANSDIVGNLSTDLLTNSPIYRKAIEDSRKPVNPEQSIEDYLAARIYSPGRSMILGIADLVPGEQGAEKLNWENGVEVDKFYRQGLPQFFSAVSDFGFNWLDPVFAGPATATKGYKALVVRPVTSKNAPLINAEIEAAKNPNVQNSWSPVLDAVAKAADPTDPTVTVSMLDNIGAINGGSGANVSKVLIDAQIVGGRELAADVLKVTRDPGNVGALDDITAKSETISAQINHLVKKQEKVNEYITSLLDPEVITPPLSSVAGMRKFAVDAPPIGDDLIQGQERLASYLQDNVAEKLRSEIRGKSALADVYLETRAIAGTMLNQTVPVTALRKLQEHRVTMAQQADDAYWGFEPTLSADGVSRVAYWVNPSGRLLEAPRGMAQLSGPAGARSDREMAARARDLAKVTGMSASETRAIYVDYKMLGTKSEMFGAFDELLIKAQIDISAKHVPDVNKLSPEQLKIFKKVYESLNLATTKSRGQVIQMAKDKNYTITVDGKNVKIPQLEALIEDMASDYALEVSLGARSVPTPAEIRYVADELIKGTPTTTSQVPGIHFAPRASEIEDFVIMHQTEIQHLVDDILDGSLSANVIDEIVKNPQDYINKTTLSGIKKAGPGQGIRVGLDNLGNLVLGYQNNVWKPMTLLGFGYTSRNVLEGLSRVAVLFAEYHQERGFKYSDMFTDFAGANVRIANRRTNKAEAKAWRDNVDNFNAKFDELTKTMSSYGKAAEDTFLNAQDSVAMSMRGFDEFKSVLDDFVSASPDGLRFLTTIKRSVDLAFKQARPKGTSEEFINALTGGDYKRAWELSVSMTPAQLTTNLSYIKNQSLETLREISYFVDKGNLSAGSFQIAQKIQISLSHISASTDAAYLGLLERARVRGELDGYIADVKLKKPEKVRQGEGQFEPIPGSGYLMDDSYANNIGQIMRGQVSSAASTSSTILNVRQQIAQTKWNMFAKEELIFPNEVIGNQVTNNTNRSWAEAFAEYSNNIYHNDALSIRILSAKTAEQRAKLKPELESWLNSRDSIEWRKNLEYEVSRYPSRADGKSKYVTILEERLIELDNMYPLKGANGEDLGYLRQKVIDRTFTNADAVAIPPVDRMPVNGVTLAKHPEDKLRSVGRWYRAKVNSIFKYLGTVPEDNFVRFPFYRTVYRNEVRRRTRMVLDAGKDPAKYEAQILAVARQEAYKQTMERLYSIERYTDLGQSMQYLSPFYMAGQNSARFWAGAVTRKPETVVAALKIWNIPNAAGIVYDNEGNRVAYDTPWSASESTIAVGLPAPVAKIFGAEEMAAPKQSLDLAFQGRIPGVPSLGGPVVDTAVVNIMRYISGTEADPDLWALRMGLGPNFIGDKVIPFYQSVKENPNENIVMRSARAFIGYGSQWKPILAVGSAISGKANLTFMTRHDSLYRSELIKLEREGGQYTALEHADAIARAYGKTIITLLTEGVLGSGPTVVKPKFRNAQQKEKDIVNSYIQKYGYEQGMLEYGKQVEAKGSSVNIGILASANVATDNIFGLFSNTETIYNFNRNKDLVAELDKLNSNSSVVGYFMNTGNPSEDFSITAEEYLYTTNINNKNIKSKQPDMAMIPYELQRRAYNNEYYPYSNTVDLMQKADAQAGREESADFYKELKDIRKAELEKKYPIYANEKDYKKQESIINDIRTMYAFTQNEKFMKTVGYNNKNVMAAYTYLYEVRPLLVADKKNKTKSTKEIDTVKLQFLEDVSTGDPELAKFLQIFFSRDDYTEIDPTNIWEKK
jgi:hypothetical protein